MELLTPTIIKQFKKENLSFIKYGLDKEQQLKQFIINRYDDDLKPTTHYAKFDFESSKTRIELKNRTCNHSTFDTTMVGYNKIVEGKKDDRDCFFLFSFADGSLFEWKLDKTREYTPTKRTDFKQTTYTPFSPTKANYYVPMKECIMIKPPFFEKREQKPTGCLIKIKC
jgi:hypothetical protein